LTQSNLDLERGDSMRGILISLALFGAALAPMAAMSDTQPQVIMATPGTGGTNGGAINRYTIRFSEAMVPLGDPRAKAPATMKCAVASSGRWADQQTFVFEFESPLPGGTSCKVELRNDLTSVRGASISGTTSFTLDTGGPSARAVLAGNGDEIEEDQAFLVATNTPATPASIAAFGYCAVDGVGEKIALDVLGRDVAAKLLADLGEEDWSSRDFLENAGLPRSLSKNASERVAALATVTAVKCRRPLPPGKDISLVWGANISSADGRKNGEDQRYDYTVRDAFSARFECKRVNPQAGCNPVQEAWVRFTADVPMAVAKAVRITFPDGKSFAPKISDDDKNTTGLSDLKFVGPFPASTSGTVALPNGLKDESGRLLSNASRFPLEVRIDQPPPLVKFAGNFGILEASEGGILPVTVRSVEPQLGQGIKSISGDTLRVDASDGEIAKWLRDIDQAAEDDIRTEKRGKEKVDVNYTGTRSLLGGVGNGVKLDLPGQGKEFEVVGIPLKAPGFYVVELASPVLGEALLGRKATRYVAAGALVTNMAVHFKWGRTSSLAWVTTLDGAAPVANADVRVTDSCSGQQIARGATDKSGRLMVSGLPMPSAYGSCEPNSSEHPLMISARASDDFSFTMTSWGEGISPSDFELPYGYDEPSDIVHTVFDRTLVRQGETVNMKHFIRRPVQEGLAFPKPINGKLKLSHMGSGTEFELPLSIGTDGIGESTWSVPKGAPQGDYSLTILTGKDEISIPQSFRVDEFRLPTMKASVSGPKTPLVRPTKVPLSLFVGYLSGGPAAGIPVSLRTAYYHSHYQPDGWDDWSFGGAKVAEGTIPLTSDREVPESPLPMSQTVPLNLKGDGTAAPSIDINMPVDEDVSMTVEMDYADANGEMLTAYRSVPLLSSALRLGIKTDGWMMKNDDLRLKLATLDSDGNAQKGKRVNVELYSREILTARRRLIGGFYAYDNQMRTTKLAAGCSAVTGKDGIAACQINPGVSGEITIVATTTDNDGNVSRAVSTAWLAGEDDWWFGGDNGDRIDLIPEKKAYRAGETANFQVRMPFREATALVTVEREGILSSFVTTLSGKNPVIKVPMPAAYAPDVFVSALVVRGRVGGWKLWTAQIAKDWGLPFLSKDGYEPSALVDLAKPSYRIGMAKVNVGWEGFTLGVKVKPDKARYAVRETANVDVAVTGPGGKVPKSAEVAFVAVDEALLQLQSNDSWTLLDSMMGERPTSVLTSTAQTQVVGKRHYGKKAVEAGGGGGADSAPTRSDFQPVLLWKGRVQLDAKGHATVPVQMADSLSAYKLVAIASSGAGLFGTGEASVRTAQDLAVYSGIPPLVRTGDVFGASFTLRNSTDKPMSVTTSAKVSPAITSPAPQTITVPAGGSIPVTWEAIAPDGVSTLNWEIEAKSGKSVDRISVTQSVIPAVPVEVWAATLRQVDGTSLPLMAPKGALANYGYVDVKLSDTLAPPLEGVRSYMSAYPYNCFEQQTSRLVVMGDGAGWDKLAADMPTYLDGDGLLRYWPIAELRGSEALTAYILSMTAEAGFVVPPDSKPKMIAAMTNVVNGKLRREHAWVGNDRFLRLSALAALARNGASTPAMLGQIGLTPADMPTAALGDWLTILDRTKGASALQRAEAEKILRQRIVYEGSRFDLTDKGTAPWWMMSSDDEMAIKALLAALGRPGWKDEEARMMVGVALRQQRGHWDTTPANAWGTIAARRFAKLYPASAITGLTTVSLGSESKTQSWPMASGTAPLRLALPMAQTPLLMKQSGGAGPWAMVSLSAAVPLTEPLSAGYKISKKVEVLQRAAPDHLTRGDVIKVTITVDALAGRNWVVVNDPVPPGATIIGGLGGQSTLLNASGGEGNYPSYIERDNDAWRGFFEWVPEGRFSVTYSMRLNGSGQFRLPATRVEAMYSPDIRGAVPNAPVTVAMR
jgi:alpha-2-macroglobulin